jgi:hypothetical protein
MKRPVLLRQEALPDHVEVIAALHSRRDRGVWQARV